MKNTNNPSLPIYLNNAATSFPKPPGMGKEVAVFMDKIPRHPGRSGAGDEDILFRCREELCQLLGVEDPRQVILCKNSTEAINMAVLGLGLNNDVVVSTVLEHNSVLRPLYRLQNKKAITLYIVPSDHEGRVVENDWRETISRFKPKLVVLNHASNVTGAVNRVESLFEFAKEFGCITMLDASQSLGLLNIDTSIMKADLIAFTGHKYLLGPTGTGGFYVRKGLELEPVFVGGTGIRSDLKEMPPELPVRMEPGTPNVPLFAGLLYSLRWQRENPVDLDLMEYLTGKLERGLDQIGAEVVKVRGKRTCMISFFLRGKDQGEIGYILDRSFGIICRTGLHCSPLIHDYIGTAPRGSIRMSVSRFNTEEEIDYVLISMKRLLDGTG